MKAVVLCLLVLLCAASLPAAVTTGSTRDEVIAAYGPPKGSTAAGSKEILVYADGRVVLENGRVVRVEMKASARPSPSASSTSRSPSQPMPPPAVAAGAGRSVKRKAAAPVPVEEAWLTDFEAAKAEATAKKKRILALFTGSDWCPPCMDFEAKVAHDAGFLNFARISFVLLKLDYPRNTPQPPALKAQNQALRLRHRVGAYPTLLIMSADEKKALKVDTRKGRAADGIADYYLQAVDEARKAFDKPESSWWPF